MLEYYEENYDEKGMQVPSLLKEQNVTNTKVFTGWRVRFMVRKEYRGEKGDEVEWSISGIFCFLF